MRDPLAPSAAKADGAEPLVRVVVAAADGSTPRETGAVMLVGRDAIAGTIGGGRLEFEAIDVARALLAEPPAPFLRRLRKWSLGPGLGQCCGGATALLFERYSDDERDALPAAIRDGRPGVMIRPTASGPAPSWSADLAATHLDGGVFIEATAPIPRQAFLYGAGHVGRALAPILASLPVDLHWVDDAEDRFPTLRPDAARVVIAKQPALIARAAPAGAAHIVMTYAHDVDLAICHAALGAERAGFVGLIGSATKRARFRKRLSEAGLADAAVDRLVCPIGLSTLRGKAPAVIAVGVAAQIAEFLEEAEQAPQK